MPFLWSKGEYCNAFFYIFKLLNGKVDAIKSWRKINFYVPGIYAGKKSRNQLLTVNKSIFRDHFVVRMMDLPSKYPFEIDVF